ncbi:Rho guanine nucleotide exchange factor [Marasmius sp. AFHP31]|nr:Rho guanine nucleotide exchange factor [Marasmius sp. AFHP31]
MCYPTTSEPIFYWSFDEEGIDHIPEEDWGRYGIPELAVDMRVGSSWDSFHYNGVTEYLLLKNYNLDGKEYADDHGYPELLHGEITDLEELNVEDSAPEDSQAEDLQRIKAFLEDAEKCRKVIETKGDEAQRWLDLLQALANYPEIPTQSRSTIFKVMLNLSKKSEMYPKCLKINNVERLGSYPVAMGGFGDVWKGKIGDEIVGLKVVRACEASVVQQLLKGFLQEAIVWQQLRHPNLLPFVGMYYFGEQLCLVSPWMERGNLVTYLENAPPEHVDRMQLAYDVAAGLSHLHDTRIVHGDIKGINVLITPELRASIGDFGLSRVADSHALKLSTSFSSSIKGTIRWQAPELLRSSPPSGPTVQSDMYAYGCIFVGRVPFYELNECAVMVAILLDRKHPSRPENLEVDDAVWELMTSCWNFDPSLRPTAADALARISLLSARSGKGDIQNAPDWKASNEDAIRSNVEYPPLDLGILDQL